MHPNGKWIEFVWDAISLATGTSSFVSNVKQGKVGAAIVDGLGVVVDAAAVVLPVVPGGAGAAIKATRAVDKVIDGTSVAKDAKKVAKYSDVPNPKNVKEGANFTQSKKKKN